MNHIIRLKDVWKIYTMGKVKVSALRGLNLQVKKGEFLSIMGPSGAGKSTAVDMIGCLDLPTKGDVYLNGKDISKMSESNLAQIRGRLIGFIFQNFNLINSLTAYENVMLPMLFQNNTTEKQRKQKVENLLKIVELSNRMHHRPTELSGGEKQRVAIARALANDPEVLLADEPTGNLDSKTGKVIIDFLEKLNKKDKKTIIMVTHDKKLSGYADRTVHLVDGKIINK